MARTDYDEIRPWAEERGGRPSCVRNTGKGGDIGILHLDFPEYSGEGSLEEISWDDWFDKFDERGLALLFQDATAEGQRSNFSKFVSRETAEPSQRGHRSTSRGAQARSRSGKASRKAGRGSRSSRPTRSGNQNHSEGRSSRRKTTAGAGESRGRSSSRSASSRTSSARRTSSSSRSGRAAETGTRTSRASSTRRGSSGIRHFEIAFSTIPHRVEREKQELTLESSPRGLTASESRSACLPCLMRFRESGSRMFHLIA